MPLAQPYPALHPVPVLGDLHYAGACLTRAVLTARQQIDVVLGGCRRCIADPEEWVVVLRVRLRHPSPVGRGLRQRIRREVERHPQQYAADVPEDADRWRRVVALVPRGPARVDQQHILHGKKQNPVGTVLEELRVLVALEMDLAELLHRAIAKCERVELAFGDAVQPLTTDDEW